MRPCRRKELALAPGKKHGGGCSGLNHPVTSLCSPSLPDAVPGGAPTEEESSLSSLSLAF